MGGDVDTYPQTPILGQFPNLGSCLALQIEFTDATPDHLLLDSAPNLGPFISRCEINMFDNC
jgi:hypothetical protein